MSTVTSRIARLQRWLSRLEDALADGDGGSAFERREIMLVRSEIMMLRLRGTA